MALVPPMVGGHLGHFRTFFHVATESRKYHSVQTLMTEMWQYMGEWHGYTRWL